MAPRPGSKGPRHAATVGILVTFSFSMVGAITKVLGRRVPSFQQIFLRSLMSLIGSFLVGDMAVGSLQKSEHKGALLLRGAFGFGAVLAYSEAARTTPLAVTSLVSRLHPLIGTVLARIVLKEQLELRNVWALLMGAAGIVVMAPTAAWAALGLIPAEEGTLSKNETSTYGYLVSVAAAVLTAAALLCVRRLAVLGEDAAAVRLTFHLANCIGGGVNSLVLGWIIPSAWDLMLIAVAAASISCAQWALTNLMARASLVDSSPFFFLSVV
eukprot:CAMPEP_0178392686 /NCGR_PEP_ID=MMETSP0689_2-20121128/11804_1 /TAXON_ID=160604 /ORGANISM="Amphidinium massartii, Strain CS-259" /LENGTH=268 /DNA_ID=CAMNT_0020013263 /DNA_START=60 /DNA_END=863 /DNA_ORIENTATION=+